MYKVFTRFSLLLITCLTLQSKLMAQCQPTSITAMPNAFCPGATIQLNATTTGANVDWYTVPSGGNAIGSSASGTDFPVTPSGTTTYYAEYFSVLADSQTFSYTGTIQTFTVPAGVTSITIDAKGAQGGGSFGGAGGLGARMRGDYTVSPGQVLSIVVGEQGLLQVGGNAQNSSGGGGGTFVFDGTPTLFVAAGGGGGKCNWISSGPLHAAAAGQITTSGGASSDGNAGGTGGSGGNAGLWSGNPCAGGGTGWLSAGGGPYGGAGYNTWTGGPGFCGGGGGGCGGVGGFGGGGGGGNHYGGGGGGGGYSGGGGGTDPTHGGGGGSYSMGTNQTNFVGYQTGNGEVKIIWSGICTSGAGRGTITVTAAADAIPTITPSAASYCAGSTVALNATTPGVSINWYDVPSGGTSIGSSLNGANFSVNPLGNMTYYAEAVVNSTMPDSQTFVYTGTSQIFVVPAGVTSLDIETWGAQGNTSAMGVVGGNGGYATGTLAVTPGDSLFIYVGGGATQSATGGYNGGGNAGAVGCASAFAGGGGGASDVRHFNNSLAARVIVGAGGGGAGGNRVNGCGRGTGGGGGGGYYGGGGGAGWPYTSVIVPTGGTQSAGGIGGNSDWTSVANNDGFPGSLGQGGNGGDEANSSQSGSATALTGGNGGGLIGNDGQYSANFTGQSGAGGSSYIGGVTSANTIAGVSTGNGQVKLSWVTPITCYSPYNAVPLTEIPTPTAPTVSITSPVGGISPLTICAGVPVTLSYTGGASIQDYVWYKNGVAINSTNIPSNTYSGNSMANGTNTLELRVVYTATPQCLSAPTSITVNQNPSPNATINASGPLSFCANTPSTLNAIAGMSNYVWKRSTTTVQSGVSASYQPTVSGNHNVTVTDANGCTKTSTWTNVTVKALPTANAGVDKNVCEGSSVQIGSTNNAANTYTWSPTTALSNPNISNPIASPLNTTTYTLTVNNASTGCSNTDAVVVTTLIPQAIPSLTSTTTPVCQGTIISITPNAVGASSINWYKNGVLMYNQPTNFIQSVTAPTISSDAYTIAAKGSNACLSGLSNVVNGWVKEAVLPTISANPQAVNGVCTVCVPGGTSGNAILLANSTGPSPTYSWKLAGNFIAGANQSSYLANVTTSQSIKVISVQATYPNGCARTSSNLTVKLKTSGCTPRLGSDKEDAETVIQETLSVGVYPNPTTGILQVNINHSEDNEGKIVLYNALGQVVLEKAINLSLGQASEELDLNHLAAGVYSLSFDTAKEHSIQKVVKE